MNWKKSFWVCLILLFASNLFWVYEILDNAVDKNYYKVVCNENYEDMLKLKSVLDNKKKKELTLNFLNENKIGYESFHKGEEFVVQLSSFELIFNSEGVLKESRIF